MFISALTRDVASLRGVGPALAGRLGRLGVTNVAELLLLAPRGYEDRRTIAPLAEAPRTEKAAVVAEVVSRSALGWGRASAPKVVVADGSAEASLLCFGRPYMGKVLAEGSKFFIWGTFRARRGEIQCADFELEPWSERPSAFGRILPVYPLTEGLTQAALRRLMRHALDEHGAGIEGEVPAPIAARRGLPEKSAALAGLHFPETLEEAEKGRRFLAYEELLHFQVRVLRGKRSRATVRPRRPVAEVGLRERLLARLPFRLTPDQLTGLVEIEGDLASEAPMSRLLQGDVGCGKTLVALLGALLVIGAGEQAAFAAPTELLARQHAENAARLLEPLGVRIAFLSGSVTGEARALLLAALRAGEIDLLFGTHALFSEDVSFHALGFVIVDEQHKFGVLQRMAILKKGRAPDLLLMTATPIPRTLALTAYGDLDISTIKTMPEGRSPVITHLTREGNEEKVYRRVRLELEKGRQAYFVYPLIGESEALAVKDAETAYRTLKEEVYPDLQIALIHSRVPEEQKVRAMADFAAGRTRVLVATSVVEVGVDVANATCMVVEHAERFGLSTLHQLRGRVGRAAGQSYAFLVYGRDLTPEGIERLKIMMETTDGFLIAERDMRLRGPGELLGVRQSGFLGFRIADLAGDSELLLEAREDAKGLLAADPGLRASENAVIARRPGRAEPAVDGG
jgi:ATP-dependent DNA helicase RecG